MEVDATSLKPIFIQISEWVEDQILQGALFEGEQVPSTNQLAAQYQINPATAGKGINLLVSDGIIYKKRGIGMFVSEGACNKILQKRKLQFEQEILPLFLTETTKLGISKEELFKMIERSFIQ